VVGRRAAAPADNRRARLHQARGVLAEVVGVDVVHHLPAHQLRQAWGRHRADWQFGRLRHHPHDVQHPLRTHDAVAPYRIHLERLYLLGEAFG
jgi:hypothetical protein